jgi:hypothetical protein
MTGGGHFLRSVRIEHDPRGRRDHAFELPAIAVASGPNAEGGSPQRSCVGCTNSWRPEMHYLLDVDGDADGEPGPRRGL